MHEQGREQWRKPTIGIGVREIIHTRGHEIKQNLVIWVERRKGLHLRRDAHHHEIDKHDKFPPCITNLKDVGTIVNVLVLAWCDWVATKVGEDVIAANVQWYEGSSRFGPTVKDISSNPQCHPPKRKVT